jgi:excisionase family DNA binding protein
MTDLVARVRARARSSRDPLWAEVLTELEQPYLVSEAIKVLGCSRNTVHRMIAAGQLRVAEHERTPGMGRYRLVREDVERLAKVRAS